MKIKTYYLVGPVYSGHPSTKSTRKDRQLEIPLIVWCEQGLVPPGILHVQIALVKAWIAMVVTFSFEIFFVKRS